MNLLKDYELLKSMNLTTRTHSIVFKNGKKRQIYYDKLYDNNKKLIKYQSRFVNNQNALHIFTGELHGGHIGIDVDCKENKLSPLAFFIKTLDILPCTLTCTTPNNGFHFVFKLNDSQRKKLINLNTCQPELFGYDIDVLYNTGRFVMSGKYITNCPILGSYESYYKIIDSSKPAFLPDILFNEIMNKCFKSNSTKSRTETIQ